MDFFGICMLGFMGSGILNLLHFHGDGKYHYPLPKSVHYTFWIMELGLYGLSLCHVLGSEYVSSVLAWQTLMDVHSIYRRHEFRVQRKMPPSSLFCAASQLPGA
ncbi:MAG TPA: hypothetical protein VL527_14315 [Dongiaceae bacterium]|jgi:hypothetical protein|nr:hypothetical protein [Dongiaceae bacterium]